MRYFLVILLCFASSSVTDIPHHFQAHNKSSYKIDPVYFANRSQIVSDSGKVKLKKLVEVLWPIVLKNEPEANLILQGHSDTLECAAKDTLLSYQRALNVKKELELMGFDKRVIYVESRGGSFPLVPYSNNEKGVSSYQNRRVEFLIWL